MSGMKAKNPLPLLHGVKPSYLVLPHDKQFYGQSLLHFLCARFPFVGEAAWKARLNSGMVVNQHGRPINEHAPFQPGETIFY